MKRFLAFALFLTLLISCAPSAAPTRPPVPSPATPAAATSPTPIPLPWWREAVFYEIFVRSFNDSDGDGIGDFNGVTQKLNYLRMLGINAIWLMPIHPSASYHGYDVLNYYAVNPQYGSMGDFEWLVEQAHWKGFHIIIDLVLNHTSSRHPWFVDANSTPKSQYRNWYVWSDMDQGNGWHKGNAGYYFGLFWDGMPDLNYRNPEVTAQMEKVARFWLDDMNVDGFRVDAAKHLIEENGQTENTPATHEWFKNFYSVYKADKPDAYTVGEVYGAGGLLAKTYTNQLDEVFNFELASGFINSANGGANSGVNSAIKFTLKDMPNGEYATFLTNHDQNRVMSVLNGNVDKAKVAASLLLTAPGTPFIYYGEEIGMRGQKPDEDIRLPMQWTSNAATAGFTTGTPWRNPGIDTTTMNVAAEDKDPNSLLRHYKTLIFLRKEHSALRTGNLVLLETGNAAVYAILRRTENETIMVTINLSDKLVSNYWLSLADSLLSDGAHAMDVLFGTGKALPLQVSGGKFSSYQPKTELAPFETLIMLMK